jgi:hypothetical protein
VPVTVKAGEKGVDFSFARPPANRLLELGYTFVVGYISVPPASPAKNISRAECEGYIAAGLKVLLVWEMSADSPNQGGPAGSVHGRNAKLQAEARGYPTDVPILTAVDTNTTASNIAAHEAYVIAFAAACHPYPVGIYGDTDILARCAGLWDIGWVPNAWSWSGSSRKDAEAKARLLGAHVLQRAGFHIDDLWAVDPNDAIADFPAWGTEPPPPPPPPVHVDEEAEDIMKIKAAGQWFEKCGVDLRAIANGAEYAGLGGNEVVLTNAEMSQLLATCRHTYGEAKSEMGASFVAAWNAKKEPAPSSGGGGAPTDYVGTISLTHTTLP